MCILLGGKWRSRSAPSPDTHPPPIPPPRHTYLFSVGVSVVAHVVVPGVGLGQSKHGSPSVNRQFDGVASGAVQRGSVPGVHTVPTSNVRVCRVNQTTKWAGRDCRYIRVLWKRSKKKNVSVLFSGSSSSWKDRLKRNKRLVRSRLYIRNEMGSCGG